MPIADLGEEVKLAFGAGGRLSYQLVQKLAQIFDNPGLAPLADAALLQIGNQQLAFSTDSHVVQPLFFPGGDIGRLAVFGTINDLAVMGAQPLFLSCGLIIEEGLPFSTLDRIVASMAAAAREAAVQVVTGDTKVVERGKGDGLYINTTGIGLMLEGQGLCSEPIRAGDKVILSGSIGDHSAAVMMARENLPLTSSLLSDCAPLSAMIRGVLERKRGVKWMRDPTRGGVAAALNELTNGSQFGIEIEEAKIAVKPAVRSFCELLGFDPLHLANEGKALMIVAAEEADEVLALVRKHELGREAALIGEIREKPAGRVMLRTSIGGLRIVDLPAGELLPRIC